MKETILILAEIVNSIHDILIKITQTFDITVTDKDLHFWIIGIMGMIGFLIVDGLFHLLSKWSITAISFIFTLTMVLVVVFALELQQGITGSGNMDFDDAVIGLVGFVALFSVFLILKTLSYFIKKYVRTGS